MKNCRKCSAEFEPTPHQLRKADYLCPPCSRASKAISRAAYTSSEKGKAKRWEWQQKHRATPEGYLKHRASDTVRKAVNRGTMKRGPCEVCGDLKTHGHHDDYNKPRQVRWLCRKHHMVEHDSK